MMLGKNIKTALILLLATAFSGAYAYDFKAGSVYYDILSEAGGTCAVTHGTDKYEGDIVIPSVVTNGEREFTVTAIGDFAFSWCTDLTSVTIPSGVTDIGSGAFSWCSSLTSLRLPDSVVSIGDHAFSGSGITTFAIPEGVRDLAPYTFYGCTHLESIDVPDGLTAVDDYALTGCDNFRHFNVDDVSTWFDISFADNTKPVAYSLVIDSIVLEEVVIPEDVHFIGSDAFSGCTGISSLLIHENVYSIGNNAFNACPNLTSVTCMAVNPPMLYYPTALGSSEQKSNATLHVIKGLADVYSKASGWKDFGTIVDDIIITGVSSPVLAYPRPHQKVMKGNRIIINHGNRQYTVAGQPAQ